MSKLADQARAYAEIDNNTHDKSFFVAYEGFKAGAEWHSREIAKHRECITIKASDILIGHVRDLTGGGAVGQKVTTGELIRANTEALRVKFRCFLSRIALANMSGTPIEDLESEFDKLFNTDENQ